MIVAKSNDGHNLESCLMLDWLCNMQAPNKYTMKSNLRCLIYDLAFHFKIAHYR